MIARDNIKWSGMAMIVRGAATAPRRITVRVQSRARYLDYNEG